MIASVPRRFGRFSRALASASLGALLLTSTQQVFAETMTAKFLRISSEPTTDKKGVPVIPMLVEIGVPHPVNDFQTGCWTGGSGAKVTQAAISCMSSKIEKEGYEKQYDFPKDNARVSNNVGGSPTLMEIVDASPFKDADVDGAGVAWLILMDASSSIGVRWKEIQEAAEAIVKKMGKNDAVMIRIMDDKATREHTKWLGYGDKQKAINQIRAVANTYKSGGNVDALISRLEKEMVGSFQELLNDGVTGADEGVIPMMQTAVILSDGGDSTPNGFTGGTVAQSIHERLVKGDLGIGGDDAKIKMPLPVISIWFPKNAWTGGVGNINEVQRNNEYEWMSNISTPEVGGYFDIVQEGETGKGEKIAKVVRARFDNMHLVSARASCLEANGEQTFQITFEDTKSKILPDKWSKVPVAFNFTKWLLDVDHKKTEDASGKSPLVPGATFDVYGDFCWGNNSGAAEAYFITEADAQAVKKASADKTGKQAKALLQDLASKGQKAETVSASPLVAKFKVPNTPALFDNKPDGFTLNLVVLDSKSLRASATDSNNLLHLKAARAPVNKLVIVGAIGGGVVLILLIAILARSGGGGGGRQRRGRRGAGAPPSPGPAPQPPGPPLAFAGVPPAPAPIAFAPMPRTEAPPAPPISYQPHLAEPTRTPPPSPLPDARKGATSFPTPCPNPTCGRSVMVPPGGTAQCAFCGTVVDAQGRAVGAVAGPAQFGLTGYVPRDLPAPPPGAGIGGTAVLAGPSARPASSVLLEGAAGSHRVLVGIESRVGRDGSLCSITLLEPRVSGVHASLRIDGGVLVVRDDKSNNGTFVNDHRIEPGTWTPVPAGSRLRFGPVEFTVRHET